MPAITSALVLLKIRKVGSWLFSLAKKIPAKVWPVAGVVLSFYLWGEYKEHKGSNKATAACVADKVKQAAYIRELENKSNQVTTKIETVYVDKVRVVHEKGKDIIRQIPIFVPSDLPDLPGSFRVYYDAAVQGEIPDPARIPEAKPVSVTDVARTTTENFTTCHQERVKFQGLWEWLEKQKALYETPLEDSDSTDNT